MKVHELVKLLQQMPQDVDVVIIGRLSEYEPQVALVSTQSGGGIGGGASKVEHKVTL